MTTEGTVILLYALPQGADITLNGQPLSYMEQAKSEFNYLPFPPIVVNRVAAPQVVGMAVFVEVNLLEVHTYSHLQRYQIEISQDIPIADDLTLTIFNGHVVLAHQGKVLADAVTTIEIDAS